MAIKGEIVIGPDCPGLTDAVVFVYLEDVSLADAPANRIASFKLTDVQHTAGQEDRVPFELAAEPSDPRASYVVRAHVAPHGVEDVQVGDLITTEFTPVDPGQPIEGVQIRVKLVR